MIKVYGISLNNNTVYENLKNKVVSGAGNVYLHGNLEDMNGYDIGFLSEIPEEDGEYPCICILANGKAHISRLFFWRTDELLRGYVVKEDDKESLLEAKALLNKKAKYI